MKLHKYPRTPHLEGSRLQPGDEDLDAVPFATLAGRPLVVEEKMDGANAAVSFASDGTLLLQSRGHFLTGGPREKHFTLFKRWAHAHHRALHELLGRRFVMYGEWLYAKHTIFYDALPHYFLEFDLLDLESGTFLSTARRRRLLAGGPLRSVTVLAEGPFHALADLAALVAPSRFKTACWRETLAEAAEHHTTDPQRVLRETDRSDDMEGLYLKEEDDTRVLGRYKWIRPSFLTTVVDSGSHWLSRPIVPNQLAPEADLFGDAR